MTKRIAELTCPECKKPIQVPFDVSEPPTLDEVTNALNEALKGKPGVSPDEVKQLLQEQLSPLKPKEGDHRHKTADELFDCPECRSWVDQTIQKYQLGLKEAKPPEQPTFEFGGLRPKESE